MFVGHYGPALAGKAIARSVPLWALVFAVQLVDVAWGVFVANGIEHVRIVPGFTASNALDLYDMPLTHSLPAALAWAAGAGLIYAIWAPREKVGGGLVIALAVFSHWVMDLLVHVPDLPLWPGGPVVGLGLWDNYWLALALEMGVLAAGFAVYLRVTEPKGLVGRIWPWVFGALLVAAQQLNHTMPPPESVAQLGYTATATFILITGLAALCDLTRRPRAA